MGLSQRISYSIPSPRIAIPTPLPVSKLETDMLCGVCPTVNLSKIGGEDLNF